jgi:GBP family porin
MKKTLIAACAAFGVVNAASAQSSATVYGLLDLNYQYWRSGDNAPLRGAGTHRLEDGHRYGPGSRLGFRATEDLGDGLKAGALIEMGYTADTGALAQGGRAFGRQAFLSVSATTLGELRLGRQYALHDETMVLNNPFGNTTLLNPGAPNTFAAGSVPLFVDTPRVDNMVHYLSPLFGGFRLQAAVAPGEGLVDRYQGVRASYGGGALSAAASYEWSKAHVGTAGVSRPGDTVNEVLELGATYALGTVKLYGGYQRARDLTPGPAGIVTAPGATSGVGTQIAALALPGLTGAATRSTGYTAGASADIGQATIAANYTRTKFGDNAGGSRTLGRVGTVGMYRFSKTTLVYAGIATHTGNLKDFINEKRSFRPGCARASRKTLRPRISSADPA